MTDTTRLTGASTGDGLIRLATVLRPIADLAARAMEEDMWPRAVAELESLLDWLDSRPAAATPEEHAALTDVRIKIVERIGELKTEEPTPPGDNRAEALQRKKDRMAAHQAAQG